MRRLLCLLLLLALPFAATAQTEQQSGEDGAGYLTRLIQDQLSSAGREVSIVGFEGALSSRATVERLTIADDEGVWLEAEGLVLDWSRSALLRRRLQVSELLAERISILRPPNAQEGVDLPSPEAREFSLPNLPLSINVDAVEADRIELGEAFLGEEVALSLQGSASLADGEGEASITAQRLDGGEGNFEIAGSYSNESRVLDLNAVLDEGEDGIVARLLDIPGRPSLRLSIVGEDPLDDYTADISLATGGEERVTGTFSLASDRPERETPEDPLPAADTSFALDVSGDVTALLDPAYRDFFGTDVSLTARGSRSAEGALTIPELQVDSEALQLSGALDVGEEGWPDSFQLDGTLGGTGEQVLLPIPGPKTYVDSATLDVGFDASEGQGWTADIAIDGFERTGLAIAQLSLDGSGNIAQGTGDATGGATGQIDYGATGLQFDDADAAQAFGDEVSGSLSFDFTEGQPVQIGSFTLDGAGLSLDGSGSIDGTVETLIADLDLSARLQNLSRFSGLAGRDLGGDAELTLSGTVQPLNQGFDLALDAQTTDLQVGVEKLDPLLAGSGTVHLETSRDTSGTRIEDLQIETPELRATATADVSGQSVQAEIDARLREVGLIIDGVQGAGTLTGTVGLREDGTTAIDLEATAPEIDLAIDGTVDTEENGYRTEAILDAQILDLGRYAEAFGQDYAGAISLRAEGSAMPLDRAFDLSVDATTQDLATGDARIDPLLEGTGTIAAQVQRTAEGVLSLREAQIEYPEVTFTGRATGIDPNDLLGGDIDADFDARLTDVGLVTDTLSGEATVTGTAQRDEAGELALDLSATAPAARLSFQGTLGDEAEGYPADGTLSARFANLSAYAGLFGRDLNGRLEIEAEGSATLAEQLFDVQVDASSLDLRVGVPALAPILDGEGTLQVHVTRSDFDDFSAEDVVVDFPALSLRGSGSFADGAGQADAEARIPDLSVFSQLAGREMAGSAQLSVEGTGDLETRSFDLTLDGETQALETGFPQIDPIVGGSGSVAGHIRYAGPRDFTVENLDLDFPAAQISGTADFEGGDGPLDIGANIPDLSVFAELAGRPLDGSLELSAKGSGDLEDMSFDVALDGQAQGLATGIAEIDPILRGAGSLSGQVSYAGPRTFSAENLDIDFPALQLRGSADVTDGAGTADLSASVPDLGVFSGLADRELSGAAQLSVEGSGDIDDYTFDARIEGQTTDLQVGIDTLDPVLAGTGTLVADANRAEDGAIEVTTLDLSYRNLTLTGSFSGNGPAGEGSFDARLADASLLMPGLSGPVTAQGTADLAEDGTFALDATATGPQASLDITGTLGTQDEALPVQADLELTVQNLAPYGRLANQSLSGSVVLNASGSGSLKEGSASLAIDARTADLGIGNAEVDRLLRGPGTISAQIERSGPGVLSIEQAQVSFPNISASGSLSGASDGSAEAVFDARLADIGLFTDEFSGPVTADGTASRSAAGDWTVDASMTGPGGTSASVAGQVAASGTLNLDATGSLPLGLANGFIEPRRLSGRAGFDLSVNGAPALSSVSGTVTLSDGRLADPTLTRALENIGGTISLDGQQAQVNVSAGLDTGGSLQVSGPVGLQAPYSAALVVTANELVLTDPSLYRTTASGRVTVDGPLTGGALIAGRIELGETEIQVPTSGIGALGDLPEVAHFNAPADVRYTLDRADVSLTGEDEDGSEAGDGGGGPGFALDVTISAPNRIFVRGRGLDAELGGELSITGTTNDVLPVGRFDLIRGRLDVLQQRFELSEGYAQLQGDFVPYLRLVATTETEEGTRVSIVLEGPANDPEVNFESSPELPQDEVLARLIFGRQLDEISPLQAVQLAAAAGTLMGRGGGGLVSDIRGGLGVDDLDITTDDEGNAALRLGAYISENLYTDVTVSSGGNTEVNLNLDVTDSITARGSVDNEGESSVGVFYERDY